MSLLSDILQDILDDTVSLAAILRKAKVLARLIDIPSLEKWIDYELNGYPSIENLPGYRSGQGACFGYWTNGVWEMPHAPVPLSTLPEDLSAEMIIIRLLQGVKAIDSLSDAKDGTLERTWAPELVAVVNTKIRNGSFHYIATRISKSFVEGVLDSIRNRLLDFLLDLQTSYPELTTKNEQPQGLDRETIAQEFADKVLGVAREKLFDTITRQFNLSDLDDLLFRMNIDSESVQGSEKSSKVREVILYCERHGRLIELYQKVKLLRPNADL